MNQYVRKIELGTNLPIKHHTASMKDWIKMLQHNYQVFNTTAEAIDVSIRGHSEKKYLSSLGAVSLQNDHKIISLHLKFICTFYKSLARNVVI